MNTVDLAKIIQDEGLNEQALRINTRPLAEGALCLNQQEDGSWSLVLNERGTFVIAERFESESKACTAFLSYALSDPTYRRDFQQSDLDSWGDKKQAILKRYKLQ